MTDTSATPFDLFPFDRGRLSQRHSTWTVAGAGAVTLGVLVGSWLIDHRAAAPQPTVENAGTARLTAAFHTPPAPPLPELSRPEPARLAATAPAAPGLEGAFQSAAAPVAALPPPAAPALIDPAPAQGPVALADSAPLPARFVPPTPGTTEAAAPTPAPEFAMLLPLPEAPHDTAPVPVAPTVVAPSVVAPVAAGPERAEVPQAVTVPLPAPRPDFRIAAPEPSPRAPRRQTARNTDTAPTPVAPGIPADNRSFLDRFFGALKPSNGPTLAYASPEDGLFGRPAVVPSAHDYSRTPYTAVYDISAHTVYMPDGSKLEAHSGLGRMIDDPRHVAARNVGPTPPHVYDLTLRESLFHGVQALRLNPVGGGGVFGRTGLLAHTFMLGPNGDSNGCVSFRDYASFLRAYQNGQVRRLVVVPGLG
ncbi:DUF2778 domain-containing protein [Lichenibacterium ramalinae]|nr:DUF2778 domain-containing protein [Lichenibacterium ramalinae]